jgi:hypothetical protein
MASAAPFPARLHVLLARDEPYAVVIRRGPSRRVCTIGWDRRDDRFVLGQWLKGRIYERRSDLSPDGRHLIYFVMNGRWRSETRGAWTALSRAPYLKAVGLWAKGDCWHGGGLFLSESTFWLNDGYGHEQLRAPELRRVPDYPADGSYGGECPGVYYLRLQRDGWTLAKRTSFGAHHSVDIFEKSVGPDWVLRKFAHGALDHPIGTGCYYDQHELENRRTGHKVDGPDWEWADLDRGRLVWCREGKLFAGRVGDEGVIETALLHDFNAMSFEPIQAPY